MPRRCLVLALLAIAPLTVPPTSADEVYAPDADRNVLRSARVETDAPALLSFLRKRTLGEKDRAKIDALIQKFSADEFEEREKASRALVEVGPVARPQL